MHEPENDHAPGLADLRRGEAGTVRVLHRILHVADELLQLGCAERRDFTGPLQQQRITHAKDVADCHAFAPQAAKLRIDAATRTKGPALTGPFVESAFAPCRLPATAAAAAAIATVAIATATVATTTTAAAAVTTATARTATAATGARLVLRLVDAQRPAIHRVSVERLDGARGVSLWHLHETEPTGPACFPIIGQRD